MEVIVNPDRIEGCTVRFPSDARHRLIFLDRVRDFDQVHFPALRHEETKLDGTTHPLTNLPC